MTVAAAAIACACFVTAYPSPIFDSWGYYYLSQFLRTHGLLAWPTDIRTYGYPFFVALATGFRDLPAEEVRLIVFGVQLSVFLMAAYFVSRRLAAILRSESAGIWAYGITALNPVLLIHIAELLSDLLSAVFIQLALAFAWKLPGAERGSRARGWQPFLSFFCAGAAMAVRPANAVVVAALALVWALRLSRWRERIVPAAFAALIGLIPPLLPQALINDRLVGRLSPFVVSDLYRQQRLWGMGALKYGTLLIEGRSPLLTYSNPFYRNDPGPRTFLRRHPVSYLTTLALHAFAMVDTDLPFTYVTDLSPGYRWPLSVVNYSLLYLALAGGLVAASRGIRRSPMDEIGFALLSTLFVCAAYLVIYLPVEVESRFGLPLQLLATPLIVVGARWLVDRRRESRSARTLILVGWPTFVLACALLSAWIATLRTNEKVPSPANMWVLDPPRALPPAAPKTPPPRP